MCAFSNAIGYILELKSGIKQNWFDRLVEYTLESETTTIGCELKESLYQELINPAPYTERSVVPEVMTPDSGTPFPREVLVSLKKFDNFKKLEPFLEVDLHPWATIIFGANGAGKSSLCAAFKCLAGKGYSEPLCNVYSSTSKCSFEYETINAAKKWESSSPVPSLVSHIKIFDSKLALSYIDSNSDPKQYIEITPFLLHLFEVLRNHLDELEVFLNEKLGAEEKRKGQAISRCRSLFGTQKSALAKFFDAALASEELKPLCDYMTKVVPETIKERLACANADYKKYLDAVDINGQRLLKLKIQNIDALIEKIQCLHREVIAIDINALLRQLTTLKDKLREQQDLISKVVPSHHNLGDFKKFLDASRSIFKYDGSEKSCPFCQREFSDKEFVLISEYSKFLTSSLETEIGGLRQTTNLVISEIVNIKNKRNYYSFEKKDIPDDLHKKITDAMSSFFSGIDVFLATPSAETGKIFQDFLINCEKLISELKTYIASDVALLRDATGSAEEQNKRIAEFQQVIDDLRFEDVFIANLELIKSTLSEMANFNLHGENVRKANLSNIRRQLSNKSKQAHADLIVPKFKEILDAEYMKIAERPMSSFGIDFLSKASNVDVTLVPKVKSKKIDIVLSEGELKVHALALFFAELQHCQEDIIIFDDPINSLDDRYSLAVGHRIRDCIKENPEKQIIILTHSYSFFVQLLQIFNKSSLVGHFVSLILENCSYVEPHVEKINELEAKIESGLIVQPFNEEVKTTLAKNIRLYIEAIINTYVFNSCRKAYQSSPTITEFHKFVHVVPLTDEEAVKLSDIYRLVSPWEHDDIRTWYLNSDKAAFETRYRTVKEIKSAIASRK